MFKIKGKQFNKLDRVEIHWIDSFREGDGWIWSNLDYKKVKKKMKYKIVGYLLYADEEIVSLTQAYRRLPDREDVYEVEAVFLIPQAVILSVRKV